jgi:hypothetical protein
MENIVNMVRFSQLFPVRKHERTSLLLQRVQPRSARAELGTFEVMRLHLSRKFVAE